MLLANTLLLDYADICYFDLRGEQLNKLERIQNVCIRYIYGLRKFDHIPDFYKRTQVASYPPSQEYLLNLLCIVFSPISPPYLKEHF